MVLIVLMLTAILLFFIYIKLKPPMAQIGPFLPDWYLLGVSIYAVGAMYIAFFDNIPSAEVVAMMALVTLISSLLGSLTFVLLHRKRYHGIKFVDQLIHQDPGKIEVFGIYFGVIFSAFIALLFVYFVFSNSVVGALLSFASITGDSTLLAARKAITSGSEGYFAPGYIKQFRDILVPIFLISIMFLHIRTPMSYKSKLVMTGAFLAVMAAMLVSGQRLIIVILLVTLMMGRHYFMKATAVFNPAVRKSNKGQIIFIVSLVVFYGGFTVLLGRLDEDVSIGQAIIGIFDNFFDRVFIAPPGENMTTYPYWSVMGPTMGESWIGELGTILPGVEGISFSNRLHMATGGSAQGNSPLGMPPDIWVAWGWGGVFVVPFIYAMLWGFIDMILISEKAPLFGALKIYIALVCPIIFSPFGFVLYGGAVALILIFFVKFLRFFRARNSNYFHNLNNR